jgi:hypothetical protein
MAPVLFCPALNNPLALPIKYGGLFLSPRSENGNVFSEGFLASAMILRLSSEKRYTS